MSDSQISHSASRFWAWFEEQQGAYRRLDAAPDADDLLDRFEAVLHGYDDALYFEVSEPLADGTNELIITAGGNRERFPSVEALVSAAPPVPGWKFVALKPASGFTFIHQRDNLRLDPSHLWFLPLTSASNPSILGLRVGVPDFDASMSDETTNAVWTILDTALGEKLCAEIIRHVEAVALPDLPEEKGYIELPELPEYLAWKERQLCGQ